MFRNYLTSPLSKDETRVVSSLEHLNYLKLNLSLHLRLLVTCIVIFEKILLRVVFSTLMEIILLIMKQLLLQIYVPKLLDKSLKQGRNTCRK